MAGRKIVVVLSQAAGKSPAKRHLEEQIAADLLLDPNVDVSLIPHLYDLPAEDSSLLFLRGVAGDMIVLAWLFPRATRWVLDRQGIRGQTGVSLLDHKVEDEDEDGEETDPVVEAPAVETSGAPNRKIYTLDLRDHATAQTYVDEIKRIAQEQKTPVVTLGIGGLGLAGPTTAAAHPPASNPIAPMKSTPLLNVLSGKSSMPTGAVSLASSADGTYLFDGTISADSSKRRWYPVIDYSRCTNCMECIDFCLFGVYGVDAGERILVEQQDNCKKGCPACSRVCPENAIIFPEYKAPAIAGAAVGGTTGIKIDLSKLFGGGGGDPQEALQMAVAERDRELVADGRTAVGMAVGLPKRQAHQDGRPKDDLDELMDGLDDLDL